MKTKKELATITSFCKKQPFDVGLFFKNLKTKETLEIKGNEPFSSGSIRKIPILMAALKQVHEKKISLDKKIKINKKYQRNKSGCFRHLKPGFTITFQDALIMMIIASDNTCTGHVVELIGIDYINQYCKEVGLTQTRMITGFPPLHKEHLKKYEDTSSPKDTGLLLDLILKGTKDKKASKQLGCSKKLCQFAIDTLLKQMYNTKIPALLPNDTAVAHKTGTRKGVTNDSGIIYYKEKPLFIISIFTKNKKNTSLNKSDVNTFIAKLTLKCFNLSK